MPISRRAFIRGAAASIAVPVRPFVLRAQEAGPRFAGRFRHGVASGDPLGDRVILWTRVTPERAASPIDVTWQVAADAQLAQVVTRGRATATAGRDFTVKVDATGLQPGRTYFYAFETGGERSPIGRTKTLPPAGVERVRLAVVSCSNYPAGYFNAYRRVAERPDLDAVVHVGDYIYEFANGVYGDGSASGRIPLPIVEAVTLADYRLRYATYRSDLDLQEAHRQHPFIVVWDDHEIANDASADGAPGHDRSRGEWATRLNAAYRAYLEWLPVRETADRGIHLYRSFPFGDMADLVMLDTRGLRDRQLSTGEASRLNDPKRTLLGSQQEAWLFDRLRESQARGTPWRLLGQQVLFSSVSPSGPFSVDMWDGYPAARQRMIDFLSREPVSDVAILTGDLHSSWALDVPANPWAAPNSPAARSIAVELLTPAISSPPFNTNAIDRARARTLTQLAPHLKYFEGDSNGYVLLDLTRERLQADWYFVPGVSAPDPRETRAAGFACERGSSRLSAA